MLLRISRQVGLQNIFIFREYARRAPNSRLPVAASSISELKTAFKLKDEPTQLVEPTTYSIADLMTSIKSATSPLQLLDTIGILRSEVYNMSSEEFMRTLLTLFCLHKATKDTITEAQIVEHPNFIILCRKLRRLAPNMDVSDNLNALKVINYLKIPSNTELSLVLVSLLRYQINDFSLQEMIYADYLLSQLTPRLDKAEAIRAALPVLFEIQLPIQFDPENITENIALLKFATSKNISSKTVGMIANILPKQLGQLDVEKRKEILRTLCYAPNVPRTTIELWNSSVWRSANMFPKLELSELLETTVMIVKKCHAEPMFYTIEVKNFLEKCIEAFIERDVDLEQTAYLQKSLKSISFKSIALLRHIGTKIGTNLADQKLDTVFTIIQAFAMADYRPKNMNEVMIPAALKNVNNKIQNPKHPTWLQFTLQLILLNHFEIKFVEQVLCKEYLTEYLLRNNFTDADYLKIVILFHEACRHSKCSFDQEFLQTIVDTFLKKQCSNPFEHALTSKLEAKRCLFNARTEHGHCIQNLLKYDVVQQQFCSFDAVQRDPNGFADLNQIACSDTERLIVIDATPKHFYWTNSNELKNVYQLRRKQLQLNGVLVFEVPPKYWVNVPDALNVRTNLLWERIDDLLPFVH